MMHVYHIAGKLAGIIFGTRTRTEISADFNLAVHLVNRQSAKLIPRQIFRLYGNYIELTRNADTDGVGGRP